MCFTADERLTERAREMHPMKARIWKVMVRSGKGPAGAWKGVTTPWLHAAADKDGVLTSDRFNTKITEADLVPNISSNGIHCFLNLEGAKTFAWGFACIISNNPEYKVEVHSALARENNYCCHGFDLFRIGGKNIFVPSCIYTRIHMDAKPKWSVTPKRTQGVFPKWLKKQVERYET